MYATWVTATHSSGNLLSGLMLVFGYKEDSLNSFGLRPVFDAEKSRPTCVIDRCASQTARTQMGSCLCWSALLLSEHGVMTHTSVDV